MKFCRPAPAALPPVASFTNCDPLCPANGMTNGIQNARALHESSPIVSHEIKFEHEPVVLASPGKVHRVGREA